MTRKPKCRSLPRRFARSNSASGKRSSAGMKRSGLRFLAQPQLRRVRGLGPIPLRERRRQARLRRRGRRLKGAVRGAAEEDVEVPADIDITTAEATSVTASGREARQEPMVGNCTIRTIHRSPVSRLRGEAEGDLRQEKRIKSFDHQEGPTGIAEDLLHAAQNLGENILFGYMF